MRSNTAAQRTLAGVLATLMISVSGAQAFASTVKNHAYTATITSAAIATSKTFPAPGSTEQNASVNDEHPGGRSAGIGDVTITGTTAGGVTFKTKGTNYTTNGLQFVTTKGTATVNPNGSASYQGSGRYTGGTGAYKRLTGAFTFTGTQSKTPTGTITLHLRGNLRY